MLYSFALIIRIIKYICFCDLSKGISLWRRQSYFVVVCPVVTGKRYRPRRRLGSVWAGDGHHCRKPFVVVIFLLKFLLMCLEIWQQVPTALNERLGDSNAYSK